MRSSAVATSVLSLVALTALAHADRPVKARPERPTPPPAESAEPRGRAEKARPPRGGAVAVEVTVAADAPAPPSDPLKKTQPPEYAKQPGKPEIRKIEDTIYNMEKPLARIWTFRDDPDGVYARDQAMVAKQLAELDGHMAALATKQPDWKRRAEYQARIAHLARAHAAQKAHYAAVDAARANAVAAADAAAEAEWQAKRTKDDGLRGALHTAAAGQVVFASAAITDATAPGQRLTTAGVAAPLHLRAFLKESPWNALHRAGVDCSRIPTGAFLITTFVAIGDGQPMQLEQRALDLPAFQARTALDLSAGSLTAGGTFTNPDEGKAGFGWITRVGAELAPGRTRVTVTVTAACPASVHGVEIAAGAIELEATAATLAELAGRGAFKMAPSVHAAKDLAKIRTKLAARYATDGELIDLRSAGEWQPARNEYGVVLARELPLVAIVKKKGTNRCTLMSVMVSEPFDGRTYGPALNLDREFPRPFVCNPK
jgi:hypothetical protein